MILEKFLRMGDDGSSSSRRKSVSSNPENSENQPIGLDLGDDSPHPVTKTNNFGNSGAPSSSSGSNNESQRRDENPFSFRHFLRGSSSSNYQNKGARPKVYPENRNAPQERENDRKEGRMMPELSSALPDFVQDHLVMEHCYLGNSTNSTFNIDPSNLPDFAPNSNEIKPGRSRASFGDITANDHSSVPLNLPGSGFPLDLPIPGSVSNTRNEPGNSKSLPDFLADSAVCAQNQENGSTLSSPERDSDRLRRELEMSQRQLAEQRSVNDELRRELDALRIKNQEYMNSLAIALQHAEDNLEKNKRKATVTETTVMKLREEIKSLTAQISQLRLENQRLRGEEAAGGAYYSPPNEIQSHRLAQELRAAASTAEHSLRQLLTGVDNLRIMATTLENLNRIEERTDPFSNFDEGAGPAL